MQSADADEACYFVDEASSESNDDAAPEETAYVVDEGSDTE